MMSHNPGVVVEEKLLSELNRVVLHQPEDLSNDTTGCTRSQLFTISTPDHSVEKSIHHPVFH